MRASLIREINRTRKRNAHQKQRLAQENQETALEQ